MNIRARNIRGCGAKAPFRRAIAGTSRAKAMVCGALKGRCRAAVAAGLVLTAAWLAGPVCSAAEKYPVPSVPDTIADVQARTDYYVAHFWDKAKLERGVADREAFAEAFGNWINPMPQATADTVYAAVGTFMSRLDGRPDDLLLAAQLAEDAMYADGAVLPSDELYRAFIKPVLTSRNLDRALKARYAIQYRQLGNSLQGWPMAPLPYIDARTDSVAVFEARPGRMTLLYLSDPGCEECSMARVRLAADVRTQQLVEEGELDIVALALCEPDAPGWKEYAATMPETWTVGAEPGIDDLIDMRQPVPCFYIIGVDGYLGAKNLTIDQTLAILRSL